jgi:serine/threonine-protein kinase
LLPDRVADPECKRRFIKEAQAASARNHPNIVTVHDIGSHEDTSHEDTSYIAMEWVDGHTFSDMIAAKQLKLADVLKYAIQAADALAQPARWAIYNAVGIEDGGVS